MINKFTKCFLTDLEYSDSIAVELFTKISQKFPPPGLKIIVNFQRALIITNTISPRTLIVVNATTLLNPAIPTIFLGLYPIIPNSCRCIIIENLYCSRS